MGKNLPGRGSPLHEIRLLEVRGATDHKALLCWSPWNTRLQHLDLARHLQTLCLGSLGFQRSASAWGWGSSPLRFSFRFHLEKGFCCSRESLSALTIISGKAGFEGFHLREFAELYQHEAESSPSSVTLVSQSSGSRIWTRLPS